LTKPFHPTVTMGTKTATVGYDNNACGSQFHVHTWTLVVSSLSLEVPVAWAYRKPITIFLIFSWKWYRCL